MHSHEPYAFCNKSIPSNYADTQNIFQTHVDLSDFLAAGVGRDVDVDFSSGCL